MLITVLSIASLLSCATNISVRKFRTNQMGQKPKKKKFEIWPQKSKTLVNCAFSRSKTQILRNLWNFLRDCTVTHLHLLDTPPPLFDTFTWGGGGEFCWCFSHPLANALQLRAYCTTLWNTQCTVLNWRTVLYCTLLSYWTVEDCTVLHTALLSSLWQPRHCRGDGMQIYNVQLTVNCTQTLYTVQ